MEKRVINTREYVSLLRDAVREGQTVSMRIVGSSMSPFLAHDRDVIVFAAPHRELRAGDMVFYQRDSGQFVMHRIHKVRPEGLYLVGDGQTEIEGPLSPDHVFALVGKVCRKGRWMQPGDFWWEFFEHVWPCLLPLRPLISRIYGFVYKHRPF